MTDKERIGVLAFAIYRMLIGCSKWYKYHHRNAMMKAEILACQQITKHKITKTGFCVCTHVMG